MPPGSTDNLRGKRLSETFEQPVHDVEVVDHRAQEALRERADAIGIAGADRLLDLLRLAEAGRIDQLAPHVGAAHERTRSTPSARRLRWRSAPSPAASLS